MPEQDTPLLCLLLSPDFVLCLRRLRTGYMKTILLRPQSGKALRDPAMPLFAHLLLFSGPCLVLPNPQLLVLCTHTMLVHLRMPLCRGTSLLNSFVPALGHILDHFLHKSQGIVPSNLRQHPPELGVPLVLLPLKFPLQIPPPHTLQVPQGWG